MSPRRSSKVTFETARGADVWKLEGITRAQLESLPVSFPFAYAAVAIGYRKGSAFEAIRKGTWPAQIPLRQIGRGWQALQSDVLRYVDKHSAAEPAGSAALSA